MTTAEVIRQCREALRGALRLDPTCDHTDAYRAGAIWTICPTCKKRWADDEGGFKPDPPNTQIADVEAALRAIDEWEAGGWRDAAAWQALAEEYRAALNTARVEVGWIIRNSEPSGTDSGDLSTHRSATACQAGIVKAISATTPADALARRDARLKAIWQAEAFEMSRNMLSLAESGEEADEMMRRCARDSREKAGK